MVLDGGMFFTSTPYSKDDTIYFGVHGKALSEAGCERDDGRGRWQDANVFVLLRPGGSARILARRFGAGCDSRGIRGYRYL
jgi:hypothetical protein